MRQLQTRLHASVLDRLIDYNPELSNEPVESQTVDSRSIMEAVARDIENLLNTRRNILTPPPTYTELLSSLYTYGLSDFSAENPASPKVRQRLQKDILQTVTLFERRLKNIRVNIETSDKKLSGFRFTISGLLVVDPISEPVVFDTSYNSSRGEFFVSC